MCGFAGIVAWNGRLNFSQRTLARMSAAIAHRGPDGQGMWISPGETGHRAGLVHRRLAIIDPDPRADQPFANSFGRRLVYNGELYNFRQLRAEIRQKLPDYPWRTESDTEVILAAYAAWGARCVERFNGMYAFAIWDEPAGQLFLGRDRMGQKPLYYSQDDAGVVFASELGALMDAGTTSRAVDYASLAGYLRWGYINAPRTVYAAASQLRPGHTLLLSAGGGTPVRYFDANQSVPDSAAPFTAAQTRRLVEQSVERQLVADVPVGCLLSGGIDSSIVALCMRRAGAEVRTFSIGFDDPRYDETPYADAVAKALGTQHHTFRVRPEAAADLPRLAKAFGEPFADSSALPTHYLARETRQHVKVALGGDGGDELFGGYDRYRALRITQSFRQLGALRAVARLVPHGHPKSRRERFKRLLAGIGQPAYERYMGYMSLFDPPLMRELIEPEAWGGMIENLSLGDGVEFSMGSDRDVVQAALALDRQTYLPGDLLTKVDRASMLHNLEVRSPFMDHELVSWAAGLPTRLLLSGGPKRLLREAFSDQLPLSVFGRKKMGFAVPIGDWLRKELRPMLHDNLLAARSFTRAHFRPLALQKLIDEHETGRRDHAQRLYALLMLELWQQTQNEGDSEVPASC